ncbi:MAG TPA: UDP-galactopyranose mutase [Acidimicrobiia bacterium]|nr:UDP-galactopyranose mutase [Acidimicrobiia bacterium]
MPHIAVIGAGWSGAVVARSLHERGIGAQLFEKSDRIGGHSRFESINGVHYEPGGPHIFHTSHERVAAFVDRFGLSRPYEHCVLTEVFLPDEDEGRLLSWPPQVEELRRLPMWPTIERELDLLPPAPTGEDFESYVVSMMGPTLFDLFIREYTEKQWGRAPSELSSRFAPKRVELRSDGYRRLFRDTWEFFPPEGYNSTIEAIASCVPVVTGVELRLSDVDDLRTEFDGVVLTGPLDAFVGEDGALEWRGIRTVAEYLPGVGASETATAAYVVNRPSARVPFTRTVETKHATGQRVEGTIVCREYPGAKARHYPVPTVERTWEKRNDELKDRIRESSPLPIFFTGRLADYVYINQDQAIERAWACADRVAARFGVRPAR